MQMCRTLLHSYLGVHIFTVLFVLHFVCFAFGKILYDNIGNCCCLQTANNHRSPYYAWTALFL